jgi:hypothetical protein
MLQVRYTILLFSMLFFLKTHSQSARDIQEMAKADEMYSYGNFVQSLELYLKLYQKFPNEKDLAFKISQCYLNTHGDKGKALPFLLQVYKNGKHDAQLLLDIAQSAHYSSKLDSASLFYKLCRDKAPAKQKALLDHYIVTVENARALMKKPVNVRFDNLGKEINTKHPDYYPFVSRDHSTLYFTSRREDCIGSIRTNAGYFSSDIFYSKVKNGNWQKSKNMGGPINTAGDEQIVGLSADGQEIIFYTERPETGSLLMHTRIGKSRHFERPQPYNAPVNSGKDFETEACISSDLNTLFFVSSRTGGYGEADIYFTHKLPNGEWGIPQNAGPNINSVYNEGFPQISDDGKTLYFSSQGHTSMGGYDIFRSGWDELKQEWGPAENIGYPVNSTDDDMMFSLAGNNRDGYISACRPGGFGDLDIYKVTFLDQEQQLTALVGNVRSNDTLLVRLEAMIAITNIDTNEFLDEKEVNKETGRYVFIVEPGRYKIEITAKGHKPFSEEIRVFDKSDFTGELIKDFLIDPSVKVN